MNWTPPRTVFMHLRSGDAYRVVKAFKDYDGREHPVGETWRFEGHAFLPYDDGLSLFVEVDGHRQQIRMQWRPEEQGPIIDALQRYVEKVA